jgi:hypothetical protein
MSRIRAELDEEWWLSPNGNGHGCPQIAKSMDVPNRPKSLPAVKGFEKPENADYPRHQNRV